MYRDPVIRNILTDITKSLNIEFPYRLSGNRAVIKIKDNILLNISIKFIESIEDENLNIHYAVLTIPGSILETDEIDATELDNIKIEDDCKMWVNLDGKEYGEIGHTDLTSVMPNTLYEINEIIEFYSK